MSADAIKQHCEGFLHDHFGQDHAPGTHGQRPFGLRLVCLGNPERTVQGELVHHLRKSGYNAVSECGISNGVDRYSPDIVVFDDDWNAQCVVELKHHSANQGSINPLVYGMLADLAGHKEGPHGSLPLIQIGLFTEISGPFDRTKDAHPLGLYRFLSSYVKDQPRVLLESQEIPASLGGRMVRPGPTEFQMGSATIVGRVGWVLHLT